MNELIIIKLDTGDRYNRLFDIIINELKNHKDVSYTVLTSVPDVASYSLKNKKILVMCHLSDVGMSHSLQDLLRLFRNNLTLLEGSAGGVIVDGDSEWYTKETGRELVFTMNKIGCAFPGKSLVEGTGSLMNYMVTAKNNDCDLLTAYYMSAAALLERLLAFRLTPHGSRNLLCIHASNHNSSNTYAAYEVLQEYLADDIYLTNINVRNGELYDCSGCPFKMCLHFAEKGSCFYGGVMVEQAYPALRDADGLLMLCPNYNDSISANLSAFINRMTALYRSYSLDEKKIYSIIVSGYSGGDIVARQALGALNMNKGMILPPDFALIETANDPGALLESPGIKDRIHRYAESINRTL